MVGVARIMLREKYANAVKLRWYGIYYPRTLYSSAVATHARQRLQSREVFSLERGGRQVTTLFPSFSPSRQKCDESGYCVFRAQRNL